MAVLIYKGQGFAVPVINERVLGDMVDGTGLGPGNGYSMGVNFFVTGIGGCVIFGLGKYFQIPVWIIGIGKNRVGNGIVV